MSEPAAEAVAVTEPAPAKPIRPRAEPGQTVVDLPSGHFAVLRDAKTVLNSERNTLVRGINAAEIGVERGIAAEEHTIRVMLHSWTHPHPHPRDDQSALDSIPAVDITILAAAADKAAAPLFPSVAPSKDPLSPTKTSAG